MSFVLLVGATYVEVSICSITGLQLTMLSNQLPSLAHESHGVVVKLCQALEIWIFAFRRKWVDRPVAIVEVGEKRIRSYFLGFISHRSVTPTLVNHALHGHMA